MPSEQLEIPGMLPPSPKTKKVTRNDEMAQLQARVLKLELELTLLKIQLDA